MWSAVVVRAMIRDADSRTTLSRAGHSRSFGGSHVSFAESRRLIATVSSKAWACPQTSKTLFVSTAPAFVVLLVDTLQAAQLMIWCRISWCGCGAATRAFDRRQESKHGFIEWH